MTGVISNEELRNIILFSLRKIRRKLDVINTAISILSNSSVVVLTFSERQKFHPDTNEEYKDLCENARACTYCDGKGTHIIAFNDKIISDLPSLVKSSIHETNHILNWNKGFSESSLEYLAIHAELRFERNIKTRSKLKTSVTNSQLFLRYKLKIDEPDNDLLQRAEF